MSNFVGRQNPSPSIFVAERGGLRYRDPQGGGDNKKILPRSARDVFCSSPSVVLRLPTAFSQNTSPSIFLLRREGDCVTAIPKGEAITKKSCLAPLGMSFVRVLMLAFGFQRTLRKIHLPVFFCCGE